MESRGICVLQIILFLLVMIIIDLKSFSEEVSDQTIEITHENTAYYYVEYCKQDKIKVNESKIDNSIERMQQPLISDKLKAALRK